MMFLISILFFWFNCFFGEAIKVLISQFTKVQLLGLDWMVVGHGDEFVEGTGFDFWWLCFFRTFSFIV